ncbi:MAG TPA: hypothetical protein VNC78_11490, partial [Actinomycetota bacterium]|nr:hypothetical protein [Actinomycetota bacterium]
MKQVTTTDPGGTSWTIRRRWLPWTVRWRGRGNAFHALDGADLAGSFDDLLGMPLLLLLVGALLVIFLVLPIVLLIVELVVTVLVVAVAVVVRILFGRPWLVDAFEGDGNKPRYVWGVPGWSASGRAVDDVAGQISSGTSFPIVRGGKLVEGTLSSGPS